MKPVGVEWKGFFLVVIECSFTDELCKAETVFPCSR